MRTTLYILFIILQCPLYVLIAQPVIKLQQVHSGFTQPICLDYMQDHLYVTQKNGIIRVVDPLGNTLPDPFLDISTLLVNIGERGLLGFAFHPDYINNGYFYVNYSQVGTNSTILARYSRSLTDPLQADPNSGSILSTIAQPFDNHNGGDIKFGPDGMLYISSGDGGSGGDPQNNSQTITTGNRLGKILRYDVGDGTTFTVPSDNPFFGVPNTEASIWAYGLRNAWRFSFGASGIWIADVGQSALEEINLSPSGLGGVNYGWRCYEGTASYNPADCGPAENYTFPVYEYSHALGSSITGGYQYAGTEYPLLSGYYVCADYITGRFFTVHNENGTWVGAPNEDHTNFQFATFGQDPDGNMYVAGLANGIIYKIVEFCSDYIPTAVYDGGELTIDFLGNVNSNDVTFQWLLDGNVIPNATSPVYIPLVDGDYSVVVTHNTEACEIASAELFVDVTILDLNIKDWNVRCENERVHFDLTWHPDDQLEKIVLQTSIDGKNWINVKEIAANPEKAIWSSDFSRGAATYVRLMSADKTGVISYSEVKYLDCPEDGILIFPSPAKESFFISSLTTLEEVALFNIEGKVVQTWTLNLSSSELDLNNHPPGFYMLQVSTENGLLHNIKLIIGD